MRKPKSPFKVLKFAGLSLGGGKGRKTCLSILEYFVKEKKLFLSELHENIGEKAKNSADTEIVKHLLAHNSLKRLAIDAPMKLPKCLRCRLSCPGHEKCSEPEIRWMWKLHKKREPKKRPNKIFTPYTERCVEQHLVQEFGGEILPDHGFGSNRAPLAARAFYLGRRLKGVGLIEVLPRLSVLLLNEELGISKSRIMAYKQLTKGESVRRQFLDRWSEKELSFIYHRDFKLMVKDCFAFESFVSAYTAFLHYKGKCQKPPKDFPRAAPWIAYPQQES